MANEKLKAFISKFRDSKRIATSRTVDFLRDNTTAGIIEDFNRKQLAKGRDANDKELGNYSEMRTMQRIAAGKQVRFIDLKFTGEWYDNIFASSKMVGKKPALVMGNTEIEKTESINSDKQHRFDNALGLNEENRDKVGMMVALHIRNELLKYYMV